MPDHRLLVGTNNPHKVQEIARLIGSNIVDVVCPSDLGIDEEPIEDGDSFDANALIKARYYLARSGLPCLADDSGLVVDALHGRPGIYSSRYAPTNEARIERLLHEMNGVPDGRRQARFVCAAAFIVPEPPGLEKVVVGECDGIICREARGRGGFGYDPVFFLPDLDKTMAEISQEEKNYRSHRGEALRRIMPYLLEYFGIEPR